MDRCISPVLKIGAKMILEFDYSLYLSSNSLLTTPFSMVIESESAVGVVDVSNISLNALNTSILAYISATIEGSSIIKCISATTKGAIGIEIQEIKVIS